MRLDPVLFEKMNKQEFSYSVLYDPFATYATMNTYNDKWLLTTQRFFLTKKLPKKIFDDLNSKKSSLRPNSNIIYKKVF